MGSGAWQGECELTQVTQNELEEIIEEYVAQFVPAMLNLNYHLILVKGGPDYPHLSEQSHFAHIVNGVFGFIELVKFIVAKQIRIPDLDETTVRKAIALFSIHEVHKATDYEKIDQTEFSIPLERLWQEYNNLGLNEFAEVDEFLMRQANLHKRSYRHGDRLLSDDKDSSLIYLLTRIADTFASVKSPGEAKSSLNGYLKDLGPAFSPKRVQLYYHEVRDVRGVLTNTLHHAVAHELSEQFGLFPLLYFATGTLYIGSGELEAVDPNQLQGRIVQATLQILEKLGKDSDAAIRVGQRVKYFDFEKFVYSFASVPKLLDLIQEDSVSANIKVQDIDNDFSGLLAKKDLPTGWNAETVESKLAVSTDVSKSFKEHWARARRYFFYVDKVIREIDPEIEPIDWFLTHFPIPDTAATNLHEVGALWAKGGPGKYVIPIAYHFLLSEDFVDRTAEALEAKDVIGLLHKRMLIAMESIDTRAGRQVTVSALGFQADLMTYLNENLRLSWNSQTLLPDDGLEAYAKPKNKNPSTQFCSLCGRSNEYVQEIRTGILDDFAQIFSNRMLPVNKVQGNKCWCPICHLEFIFRKLTGLGLPSGMHYKNSYHIFLYALPTFSFTPEHIRLFRRFMGSFQNQTRLPVRDFGQDWGLPRFWLEKRQLDPDWIEQTFEVLETQAEKIQASGGFTREGLKSGRTAVQPHYYLIKWAKNASENDKDKPNDNNIIATRTEAWSKAIFAAAVIAGLTSCKVYVTERPYLPISDPAELKATIHLDSPPPPVRGLLGNEVDTISLYGRELGNVSGLERVLDLSASLWTVTADVHAPNRNTKDKYIAERLGTLNVNELAGAHFYKEFARLNDGATPYKPLATACQILLETQKAQGGQLMNLVEDISKSALIVRLPFHGRGRGKMHNYELAFREAMDALRKSFPLVPELRQTALTGKPPSIQAQAELKTLASGTLLKAMERRLQTGRGDGLINPFGGNLNQLVRDLIDILVDKVYLERANGSFTAFMRLENSLADGVYYYTDRNLSTLWQKRKEMQAEKENNNSPA